MRKRSPVSGPDPTATYDRPVHAMKGGRLPQSGSSL